MIYEFQERSAATDAVREIVQKVDADCEVEVMMTNGPKCLHPPQTVPSGGLKPLLDAWLQNYPRSLVRYTVERNHFISATIWCHCNNSERGRCPIGKTCPGAPKSPKATIILSSVAGKNVFIGSRSQLFNTK
jgi:hypothetical protein